MSRRIRKYKKVDLTEVIRDIPKKASKKMTATQHIRAYYQKNKRYIDTHVGAEWLEAYGTPYKAFKNLVQEKMRYTKYGTDRKYTVDEAIQREINSKDFNPMWTSSDVYSRNFLSRIKKDKELRKGIIEKTDISKKIVYERKGKGGKFIQVQRLREKFKAESIKFEGYYLIGGTNAIVYSYDNDTYIIEYKSPKKGQGATFDVVPKAEWDKNVNNGYINKVK